MNPFGTLLSADPPLATLVARCERALADARGLTADLARALDHTRQLVAEARGCRAAYSPDPVAPQRPRYPR